MPTRQSDSGSSLLIVDNSEVDWKAARYLHDWCQLSRQIDIATGYFEVGALLALKGEWQKVDKIRILMGDEVSKRTRAAFQQVVANKLKSLDASLDAEKEKNAFLDGVPAIVEGLRSGKIECRVYRKEKFHAKAYITHSRVEVVGAAALVGSSNFTKPGLTENIELNVQITGGPVTVLQEWFEEHWAQAEEATADVLRVFEHHVQPFKPFDVWARSLHELFGGQQMSVEAWERLPADRNGSVMFGKLDRYQQDGYWNLIQIAQRHGGAFLCDGVGLGKTYVGLMLLERLIHDRKRVALIVPKSGRKAVWEASIKRECPHLLNEFNQLIIINHTDLVRGPSEDVDWPARMENIRLHADVVVIDEAHHFRNRDSARFKKLHGMLRGPKGIKQLYMLTATPINNSVWDFKHLLDLFASDDKHFAKTLGVHSLPGHFRALENAILAEMRKKYGGAVEQAELDILAGQDILAADALFPAVIVQRSRAYVVASQKLEGGNAALFPDKEIPKTAAYDLRKTYGRLLGKVEKAFSKKAPLFVLPVYYPLAYYTGPDKKDDSDFNRRNNRQKQVVSLIRTMFLKRFESSTRAFQASCERLVVKLLTWVEVQAETPDQKRALSNWKLNNSDVLDIAHGHRHELFGDVGESEEDLVSPEMLAEAQEGKLDSALYNIDQMLEETYLDLSQLAEFLLELKDFKPAQDDKLKKLIKLLKSDAVLSEQKCLIFTEFADTARYLKRELVAAGIEGVEEIDGSSSLDRAEVIRRFAPYYNGSTSGELAAEGLSELRVLISTDILSEGLNLQDSTRMINYDIHWNPVRLMQRIGRVDRRMHPGIEKQMVKDHPEYKALRGKVAYWNFLPPGELDELLKLYSRVAHKSLVISHTLGIEGRQFLTETDDYNALRELNAVYEGAPTDIEALRLEYYTLLRDNPELAGKLDAMPGRIFSGRSRALESSTGIFFCFALPGHDAEAGLDGDSWTLEKGEARWYWVPRDDGPIIEEAVPIAPWIRSTVETPRRCVLERASLDAALQRVERHIRNSYLKRLDAPMGVKPVLRAWMELNEGSA